MQESRLTELFLWYAPSFDMGFPCGSAGKESACNVGDLGLIPGLGRFPGEGKGYPLQYSSLENSMDCIVHGVARVRHDWATFTFILWTFTVWGQYLVFSHPESPQGSPLGVAVMWWLDGCNILCLQIWQAAFLVLIIKTHDATRALRGCEKIHWFHFQTSGRAGRASRSRLWKWLEGVGRSDWLWSSFRGSRTLLASWFGVSALQNCERIHFCFYKPPCLITIAKGN